MEDLHPESLQVCPYDPSHIIRTKRMQMHIHECRKSHPTSEKESCPFNASHVILVAERRWHLATCPDRHQVAGIIAQDLLPEHGSVETPAYEPLQIFDETWDDANAVELPPQVPPPQPQPVARQAPRTAVTLTDQEVRGLNPRQRQLLYLQRKAEQEAAERNSPPRSLPNRELLHAQNLGSTQSRSLALFEQKVGREKKAPFDLYQHALKGSERGNMGIGRGSGGAARGTAPRPNSSGALGRGRDQAPHSNSSSRPSPSAFTPTGSSAGGAAVSAFSPPSSGDASFHSAVSPGGHSPVDEANSHGQAQQMTAPVRGLVRRPEVQAGLPRRGAGATPAARGPLGVQRGRAAPVTVGALSRGSATGFARDSMGIPYRGMASQPSAQAPPFSHSTAPGSTTTSIGQGYSALSASGGAGSEQPRVPSSDGEGGEPFVDAVPWVGGGYSHPADVGERGPVSSSSSMSLLAAPAIGPWAMEVEKTESLSESRSVSSINDSEDFDGSDGGSTQAQIKDLKKLQKKLKQIKDLEAKKARGEVLNPDQEEKLKKKEECEREIDRLQKSLN